jgi:putative flippase GtrA
MPLRFFKYSLVGASGVLINLGSLYLARNYLFSRVEGDILGFDLKLNLSLITAIFCSIVSNFLLNKKWTWADKKFKKNPYSFSLHNNLFLKYIAACSVSISMQFIVTNLLVMWGAQYLISNFIAIGLAAVFGYLINHKITFVER